MGPFAGRGGIPGGNTDRNKVKDKNLGRASVQVFCGFYSREERETLFLEAVKNVIIIKFRIRTTILPSILYMPPDKIVFPPKVILSK